MHGFNFPKPYGHDHVDIKTIILGEDLMLNKGSRQIKSNQIKLNNLVPSSKLENLNSMQVQGPGTLNMPRSVINGSDPKP
jgi:hypothetical protein